MVRIHTRNFQNKRQLLFGVGYHEGLPGEVAWAVIPKIKSVFGSLKALNQASGDFVKVADRS